MLFIRIAYYEVYLNGTTGRIHRWPLYLIGSMVVESAPIGADDEGTMNSVRKIRWTNARKLVDQHGGVVKFGEKLGMSKQQASHIFGAKPIKGIGHSIARRIEKEFNLEEGWMDADQEMILRLKSGARQPTDIEQVLSTLSYKPAPVIYEALKIVANAGLQREALTTVASLLMAHEMTQKR